jgi:hypothetical protein
MQKENEQELSSKLPASCPLLGMIFTVVLRLIHEHGHCCGNLKSNFLVPIPGKKILMEPKRPCYNFCFSTWERDLVHINYQSGFSGNGVPVK